MAAQLGSECRQRREAAGLSLMDVAVTAGVSQTTVHAFEVSGRWRRDTDDIVDAYARLFDTTPAALWHAAADRDDGGE